MIIMMKYHFSYYFYKNILMYYTYEITACSGLKLLRMRKQRNHLKEKENKKATGNNKPKS